MPKRLYELDNPEVDFDDDINEDQADKQDRKRKRQPCISPKTKKDAVVSAAAAPRRSRSAGSNQGIRGFF